MDFEASGEIALLKELPEEPQVEEIAAYESLCERYNLIYAARENDQVLFAASMAAWWLTISPETVVTYMTQGDERVRPWHLSLEGISYRKSEFPPELIPPIEWGCRCFLVGRVRVGIRGAPRRRRVPPVRGSRFPGESGHGRQDLLAGSRLFCRAAA